MLFSDLHTYMHTHKDIHTHTQLREKLLKYMDMKQLIAFVSKKIYLLLNIIDGFSQHPEIYSA